MLECSLRRRLLQTSAYRVFKDKGSHNLRRSLVGFEQIIYEKTETSLKSSASNAYPVHTVLHSFKKDYETCFIEKGHSLEAYLSFESATSVIMKDARIWSLKISISVPDVLDTACLGLKIGEVRSRRNEDGICVFFTNLCAVFWMTCNSAVRQGLEPQRRAMWN